jgi:hypothetical protein
MITGFPFRLNIPTQGVSLDIKDVSAILRFTQKEAAFFQKLSSSTNTNIVFANTNYGSAPIFSNASRLFENIEQDTLRAGIYAAIAREDARRGF